MSQAPSVRTFAPHEWRTYRDLRLRALADSPDAFGRTLTGEQQRQDVDWAARLALGADARYHLPLVAEVGAKPVGLAWGRIDPSEREVVHVYQMWVGPNFRRLGIGRMLLGTIITWAKAADARELVLGVTSGNTAATRLYTQAGFKPVGELTPLQPGSSHLGQLMKLTLGDKT